MTKKRLTARLDDLQEHPSEFSPGELTPAFKQIDPENSARPSKSALKRHMILQQQMGEALMDVSVASLRTLPISESLLDALIASKTIKTNEGLRRQRQLIGKLMRNEDSAPIERLLQQRDQKHFLETASLRRAEQWRNRLIDDPAAWEEFLPKITPERRAEFLNLIEMARTRKLPNHYSRELFKRIRSVLGSGKAVSA